jgi:hypothetical protein
VHTLRKDLVYSLVDNMSKVLLFLDDKEQEWWK